VIRGLAEMGIADVIAGTSAGALVGAAYACGKFDEFERWLNGLAWKHAASEGDGGAGGGRTAAKGARGVGEGGS